MSSKYMHFKGFTSILLVISMVSSMLSGCAVKKSNSQDEVSTTEIETEQIVETTAEAIVDNIINDNKSTMTISTNWEDYQGDVETFVYGLIINELKYKYDVFQAYVELLDGTQVCGLAYTDYSEYYANDDETKYCFETGFIPFVGEVEIPEEDFNSGLTVYDLEYSDQDASFVWAYGSSDYQEHCVVYDQYVKYGVDESGRIFYEATDYNQELCDESLGSLYSYDEAKYLYDEDVGTYTNITGISAYSQIDYDELQNEINTVLKTQDANLVSVDVKSCAYIAQEAVTNYLLSFQEETFLGYDVKELVETAKELDPMECYRLTEDGPVAITMDYDGGATALTKWLVGTGCVIVTAVAMVGSVVFIECPPLSSLSSAMAGTAIEIFMEVVISGEQLSNVDWEKVALAAATGAVSGFLGPYIYATSSGAAYFVLDSALDGFVGGIEQFVSAWMDGEDGEKVIKAFGYGFALGFALSAGFKGAGVAVEKMASKITPSITKMAEKLAPNLTSKVSKLSTIAENSLSALKKKADSTICHSKYISKKLGQRQLNKMIEDVSDGVADQSFHNLSNKIEIVDENGNVITKKTLKELFNDADDGVTVAYFKKDDDLVGIVKKNGMVGIVFDPNKYQTVTLPNGLVDNRDANFKAAAEALKQEWLDDPSKVPEFVAQEINSRQIELEDMLTDDIVSLIKQSDWVLHENIDITTITLVPRKLHDGNQGGISHMGGYGLAKFIKSHMGTEYFDTFVSLAAA